MTFTDKLIKFCLENKLVVFLMILFFAGWGIMVAPFDWQINWLDRQPVAVDAIPDIGENQQIVFTDWMGRSPRDVEDQITYPLTVSLLGIPGVKTIRSFSMFGFSTVYVIFNENIDFYWSRSRVLEKLSSIPPNTLPAGVQPTLGPDATPLGQIFWYTIEGRDKNNNPTGGWDLHELRSVQDWFVKYSLQSAQGVSEVSSIGGFVKEYQIDVNPDKMRIYNITLTDVYTAIKMSNMDVGGRTIEINKVEYLIRGLGFIKHLSDIKNTVVKEMDNTPIFIKDIATVALGPAYREGVLDKEGVEAVGGVVVTRYGANPLEVIKNVKEKILEIEKGLPSKTLADGTISQLKIIPFYDRTGLIHETLGTLNAAINEEILITIIVILLMIFHLKSSLLVSAVLPMAVLMSFIGMKVFGVDANIVSLSGIAIAIGTIVDMGIIMCSNILEHLENAEPEEPRLNVIFRAASEVGGALLTAITTTVISFLPIFLMDGPEGKLFKPLAYTKTFALIASIIVALTIIPPLAHILFSGKISKNIFRRIFYVLMFLFGIIAGIFFYWWAGAIIITITLTGLIESFKETKLKKILTFTINYLITLIVIILLASKWLPLGPDKGLLANTIIVIFICFSLLGIFFVIMKYYQQILGWCLNNKLKFLALPALIVLSGLVIWLGFAKIFAFIPNTFGKIGIDKTVITTNTLWSFFNHKFPGLGKEFMPALDEGSYLYMPTTMPHASIAEATDALSKLNMSIKSIPEIEEVVGKIGRVESALDPAPLSMIETVINYKSEYLLDKNGERILFKFDNDTFVRTASGELIQDADGKPFRQWREHIKKTDDIWKEIVKAGQIPGLTSAPKLQPIAARIVMLQSGMRSSFGVKIKGPTLESIEQAGIDIERLLKEVPMIEASSVIADRIIGKPYLEIEIDRIRAARYGLNIEDIQRVIEIGLGGEIITTTVEGRERYPVRARFQRELRDSIEAIEKILIPTMSGAQIPLIQVVDIKYKTGPQEIKSEDTFLMGYVLFDKIPAAAEVDVVQQAQKYLDEKLQTGELTLLAGVTFTFAGNYINQIRAERKLMIVIPVVLFIIFLILYFQFKSTLFTFIVFIGIFVAWSGGFMMIWFYNEPWFLDFALFGVNLRDVFQIHTFNLSVAVWVGFLALFGIATDDGVVMMTYLCQNFKDKKISDKNEIHKLVIESGSKRIRPCLMTTATTLLALLPVLTSTGRGADVMIPMAIPVFGGMLIEIITMFITPVLFSLIAELRLK